MRDENLERVRRVLGELGWDPQPGRTPGSFFVDFGGSHVPLSSGIAAVTEHAHFVVYLIFGVAAAPDRIDDAVRFITRANYGLSIGCFELSYDSGRIQFRSSVDFEGIELSEKLIVNVVAPAMAAVEEYGEALIEVLAGRKDADAAIDEIESV